MNWSVDWSWWARDPRQEEVSDRLPPGLVAANGVASLAATDTVRARRFVDALWNLEVPRSKTFRYYDGLLCMMSLMHAAGRFQVIEPGKGR